MKPMKRVVTVTMLLLLVGLIVIASYTALNRETKQSQDREFYVGVTYCGSSIQEAKELINKVKGYTNLFILQSGPLATDSGAINEIGDYVCAANLNYAIFGSSRSSSAFLINNITLEAKARWGEQFIGIYYLDEPGGNLLDSGVDIQTRTTTNNITTHIMRTIDGTIHVNTFADGDSQYSDMRAYFSDGRITSVTRDKEEIIKQEYKSPSKEKQFTNGTIIGSYKELTVRIDYYLNGTITINENTEEGTIQHRITDYGTYNISVPDIDSWISNFYTAGNITKYPREILSYEELVEQHPLRTMDSAAEFFVNSNKFYLENINKEQLQNESILVFTADYGLYWWDYQSGYDFVLAELGWNHTITVTQLKRLN